MKISNNFKLMHITDTQMIAHYSVNFDPIQNPSKHYLYNHWIRLKKFQGHNISGCAGRRG